ncbi:MAG: proprotein convertase P-domain-containing protein [Deltaproteobacteria bacterium]|nr:proprotein convertase P-domain-containing protein [Deltaproteobacteria bacterium]
MKHRQQRRVVRFFFVFMLATNVQAFVEDDRKPLIVRERDDIVVRQNVIRTVYEMKKGDVSSLLSKDEPLMVRDRESGAVRLLWGRFPGVKSIRGKNPKTFVNFAKKYIDEHQEWFGVESKDVEEVTDALYMGKTEQFIKFHIRRGNVPIQDASIDFRFKKGKLVQIANQSFSEAKSEDGETVTDLDDRALGYVDAQRVTPKGPVYRVIAEKGAYRLAQVMSYEVVATDNRRYKLELDMMTGKVHELSNQFFYLRGEAKADLYPRWYNQPMQAAPLSFLDIQTRGASVRSTLEGLFSAPENDQPKVDGLNGLYVSVKDINGNDVQKQATRETDVWRLYAMKGGQSNWLDKSVAQHMIFDKVTEIVHYAKKFVDTPWFARPLIANANLNSTCNAHWDGRTINLYSGSNQCANTGLISDVIYHEWGHGLDANTGGIEDGAFSEGYGDIMSLVMTRSHILGIGFRVPDHSPVRDLEPDFVYPRDRGEVHSEGLIIGSTFWDLYEALREQYDDNRAIEMLSNFAFKMVFTARSYLDVYDALLVIDDNDQDLSNGTPHMCLLNEVFEKHGIAQHEVACDLAAVEAWEVSDTDRDGVMEPGEEVDLRFIARNASNKTLEALKGELSVSQRGVVVEQASLNWDSIPQASSKPSRDQARLQIGEDVRCGTIFPGKMKLSSGQREISIVKDFAIGRNQGTPQAFVASGLPIPIVDHQTVIAKVRVQNDEWEDGVTVYNAALKFDIRHSYVGDLTVHLRGPGGESAQVFKGQGSGDDVHFDQDVTVLAKGKKAVGEWRLEVNDSASQDQGYLDSFSLKLTPARFLCNT